MSYKNSNDIIEYKEGNSTVKIKRKKKTARDNVDYVYINVKYFEPIETLVPTVANFDITRVDPVLDKCSDYKLAVIRWNIPVNFPSLLMPEQSVLNSDFNVALTYGSTTITEPIIFIDLAIGAFYPRGVYNIIQYIDMLNIAYKKCHDQLKLAEPVLYTAILPPTINYDPNSINKISLWAPIEFIDTNPHNGKISTQIKAQQLGLQSIPAVVNFNLIPPLNICNLDFIVHLDLTNYYKTQAPYAIQEFIILQGEFDPLSAFNKLNNLLFETSSIPVSQELIGKETSVLRSVISDYFIGAEPTNIGDSIYYNPTVLRWYNLNSDLELRNINIRPLVEYSDGRIFPTYIQANQSWGIKLLFQRLSPIQKLGFQMTKSLSLKDETEFKEELNDEF